MATLNFNANNVEPLSDFSVLPANDYTACITSSEMRKTKSGTGSYLVLEFQILEGEHKGRNLWVNLNLKNPNEKAVQIAQAELSSICRATNVLTPQDSSELHNIPMIVKVTVEQRKDTGEPQNRIKKYSTSSTAAAKSDKAPWEK